MSLELCVSKLEGIDSRVPPISIKMEGVEVGIRVSEINACFPSCVHGGKGRKCTSPCCCTTSLPHWRPGHGE